MMKKIYLLISLMSVLALFNTSCNDFLDENPDNRAELDTEDKIKKLLVSAYPDGSVLTITELMTDNVDKNSANLGYERFHEQVFNWEDITERGLNDGVYQVWNSFYSAIASSNHALEMIEEWGNPESMQSARGEALITRAYNHFVLVNTFCMHYGKNSGSDLGIPYIEKPEKTVKPHYERGTVAEVYEKIERDLLEALPLIDDNLYVIPKFHFTKRAAYAFAARFYLYYEKFDKAIEYSSRVLGDDPGSILRDWAYQNTLDLNANTQPDVYASVTNGANLLISAPSSSWATAHGPFASCRKFTHFNLISQKETMQSIGPWGGIQNLHIRTWSNNSIYKVIFRKIGYYFEETNPVAQTGIPRIMHVIFTTDETLLTRAEAYALTKQYDKAIEDMTTLMKGFSKVTPPTRDQVNNFYSSVEYYTPYLPTIKKELNPDFTIEKGGEQENILQYILHVRRIITLHEGLRWNDIKRYGITIYRREVTGEPAVKNVLDTMNKGDKRQAIQLPQEVTLSGLEKNPR
jgi:tetratricopeptide (TPR) repeat protein